MHDDPTSSESNHSDYDWVADDKHKLPEKIQPHKIVKYLKKTISYNDKYNRCLFKLKKYTSKSGLTIDKRIYR